MAMEIKTINVSNDREESTINLYGHFGWTLKSSQRVFNQDSHQEYEQYGDYLEVSTVTNTIDYTKLVFERDKKMPNYDELVRLEKDAFSKMKQIQSVNQSNADIEKKLEEAYSQLDVRDQRTIAKSVKSKARNIMFLIAGLPCLIFGLISTESEKLPEVLADTGYLCLIFGIFSVIFSSINLIRPSNTQERAFRDMMNYPNNHKAELERYAELKEKLAVENSEVAALKAAFEQGNNQVRDLRIELGELFEQADDLL